MSDTGERTYADVRKRFRDWEDSRPRGPLPGRAVHTGDYTHHAGGGEMSRMVLTAIGVAIGLGLLALAGLSFWTAAEWRGVARNGAMVGYNVIGFFLTVAGLGAILATWNHNFRVLTRPPAHH